MSSTVPLDLALKEVERLDQVVRGVLRLTRERPFAAAPVDLHQLVQAVLHTVQAQADAQRVRLSLTHDGQGTQVTVDHAQISGALLNVLLNSLAALSDGGHITLHITRDSDAVRVAITDNGTGMTDETSSSAFRPFFTTRADGTGLGLPLAKRAIQENGGTLALVRSRPGEGTEFCMSFPVSGHA